MIGDPEDVDYAALELDDEQNIELGELDGVHDEEVGGQDALGLGGDELFPGRSTARNGSETVAAKDPADRACRDADPKPAKLTLNANTTPTGKMLSSTFPSLGLPAHPRRARHHGREARAFERVGHPVPPWYRAHASTIRADLAGVPTGPGSDHDGV